MPGRLRPGPDRSVCWLRILRAVPTESPRSNPSPRIRLQGSGRPSGSVSRGPVTFPIQSLAGSRVSPMNPRRFLVLAVFAGATGAMSPAQAQDTPPATVYRIAARVLPQERRLEVSGTIRIPAADSARAEIPMRLGAPMGALRVELVEPATSATLEPEQAADDDTSRV